jgi:hypothetical protein
VKEQVMTHFEIGDIVEFTEEDNHPCRPGNAIRKVSIEKKLGPGPLTITSITFYEGQIFLHLNYKVSGQDARRFKKPSPRERNKRLLRSKKEENQ